MKPLRSSFARAVVALCVTSAALAAQSSLAPVVGERQITEGAGGFVGPLLDDSSFGASVTALGDVDGNGVVDLAVGGPLHGDSRGSVWILFMAADGSVLAEQRIAEGVGGFDVALPFGSTEFGSGVAAVGDVDGDGVPDLAVTTALPHKAWVLLLNTDGTVDDIAELPYIASNGAAASLAPLGDFDGNGTQDLVLGLPLGAGLGSGTVTLLLLDTDGSLLSSVALDVVPGDLFLGTGVAAIGDLDGNGVTEVAYAGLNRLRIAFLDTEGGVLSTTLIAEGSGGFEGAFNPEAVAPVGDRDGDGVPDIAVSEGGLNRVWLFTMNADGTLRARERIAAGDGGFVGPLTAFARFGSALTPLGDLDGDGTQELAVGSDGFSPLPPKFPGASEGAVWILSLQDTWFDQGFELAGSGDAPLMVGEGPLQAGTPVTLSVTGGAPNAPVLVLLGASAIDAPFKQGVLVPSPDIARVFGFDPAGELQLTTHWPADVPAGFRVFLQAWHADAGAPGGFAGSNAVLGRAH